MKTNCRFPHLILLLLLLPGCSTLSTWFARSPSSIESGLVVHSHRGASHLPENMMSAFVCAAKMGADVIEMDLQITADDKIVVAHDPYLKEECALRNGTPVATKAVFFREKKWNTIEDFDCGTRTKPNVVPVSGEGISSLEHVLESLRRVKTTSGKPIGFNIEIKYSYDPAKPRYPLRAFYAKHVMNVIADSGIDESRILIQSFDVPILEEVRKIMLEEGRKPNEMIRLSPLIGDDKAFSHALEFAHVLKTDLITPHYKYVSKKMVSAFHAHGIQVIPWTVNDPKIKKQMLDAGVDGVITDNLPLFRPESAFLCP